MMPWDHAAFAYVAFSLFVHAVYRDSPTGRETFVVVFVSLLPTSSTNRWPGSSACSRADGRLATPSSSPSRWCSPSVTLAYSRGWPRGGWAFGFGYLLHLPGDVIREFLVGENYGSTSSSDR